MRPESSEVPLETTAHTDHTEIVCASSHTEIVPASNEDAGPPSDSDWEWTDSDVDSEDDQPLVFLRVGARFKSQHAQPITKATQGPSGRAIMRFVAQWCRHKQASKAK